LYISLYNYYWLYISLYNYYWLYISLYNYYWLYISLYNYYWLYISLQCNIPPERLRSAALKYIPVYFKEFLSSNK
jgi:hypothetical protein